MHLSANKCIIFNQNLAPSELCDDVTYWINLQIECYDIIMKYRIKEHHYVVLCQIGTGSMHIAYNMCLNLCLNTKRYWDLDLSI